MITLEAKIDTKQEQTEYPEIFIRIATKIKVLFSDFKAHTVKGKYYSLRIIKLCAYHVLVPEGA